MGMIIMNENDTVRLILTCKTESDAATVLEMIDDLIDSAKIYVKSSESATIKAIGLDGKLRIYKGTTSKEINQALYHGGIITLDSDALYIIDDPLLFTSDTVFDGNGATIKLAKDLPAWGYNGCPISEEKAMLMLSENTASNIAIRDLIVDGSQSDYYPDVRLGTSLYNMATLIGCSGLTIENCTFKNGCNDAILLHKCENIQIDNIIVNKCGHDGVYAYYVDDISVSNSTFINRTNSSCRFYNVKNGEFVDNKCSTSGGGHTGLQLQGDLKDVIVAENHIKGLPYPGILSINAKMSNVVIENNVIEKCKTPWIYAPGATVKNNKIIY
jgi:hypothetical protein